MVHFIIVQGVRNETTINILLGPRTVHEEIKMPSVNTD